MDKTMTTVEVAEKLHINPQTVRLFVREGRMEATFRIGRNLRFTQEDITKFLEKERQTLDEKVSGDNPLDESEGKFK